MFKLGGEMKKTLSKKEFITISIMLFGLFFGAGNLIFPPMLGNQAASMTWPSLLSFSITAVLFPVLGVVAVAKTGGLSNLANRIGPKFSLIYTSMIYLSIGPGLGIPRAGSMPFEMAIKPQLTGQSQELLARLLYTLIFFSLAYLISLNPGKLVDRMGKYLTPALLILILVMFLGVFVNNNGQVAKPVQEYSEMPRVKGFLEGYNTMDAVSALNFGLVISLAIKSFNIEDEKKVIKYTIGTGALAGIVLFIVYSMLAYIGKTSSLQGQGVENGAVILANTTSQYFGSFGFILLILIFSLACLTTCVGLLTSGSSYFEGLSKNKISYKKWLRIWTLFSFIVANFGLNLILKISVPILTAIYPISLILIIMALSQNIFNFNRLIYRATTVVTVFISVVGALEAAKINIPLITNLIARLPFANLGLAWLLPSMAVLIGLTLVTNVSKTSLEVSEVSLENN